MEYAVSQLFAVYRNFGQGKRYSIIFSFVFARKSELWPKLGKACNRSIDDFPYDNRFKKKNLTLVLLTYLMYDAIRSPYFESTGNPSFLNDYFWRALFFFVLTNLL